MGCYPTKIRLTPQVVRLWEASRAELRQLPFSLGDQTHAGLVPHSTLSEDGLRDPDPTVPRISLLTTSYVHRRLLFCLLFNGKIKNVTFPPGGWI